MKWNRGWHAQESKLINVGEAIRMRDDPSLKTGDIYCCQCENTRLSPVAAITRARHFRQHPRFRKESKRKPCKKVRASRKKGESWKHAMVVDEIAFYLMGEGREKYNIHNVKLGEKKSEPDLIVTHSEQLDGFEGLTSYIIVPMYNLRRSRELFFKYSPNSVAVEIHRWRDQDVDYVDYIRGKIDIGYKNKLVRDHKPKFCESSTGVPNFGIWHGNSGGLGRGMVLKIDSQLQEDAPELAIIHQIESLVDAVESHNMWAISTPGMHRYHLKNLIFSEFDCGDYHEEPSISAIIAQGDSAKRGLRLDGSRIRSQENYFSTLAKATENEIEKEFDKLMRKIDKGLIEHEVEDDIDPTKWRNFLLNEIKSKSRLESHRDKFFEHIEDAKQFNLEMETLRKEWANESSKLVQKFMIKMYNDGMWDGGNDPITISTEWGDYDLILGDNVILNMLNYSVPQIHFWDSLSDDEKYQAMKEVRSTYRKVSIFRGVKMLPQIVCNIELGEKPVAVADPNNIENITLTWKSKDGDEFSPISHHQFVQLLYMIEADKDFSFTDGKHHSFTALIHKMVHSTDNLVRRVNLDLPQPIEDLIDTLDGNISDTILDLLGSRIEVKEEE